MLHPYTDTFLGLKIYVFINFYPSVVQGRVVYKGCSLSNSSETDNTKYLNTISFLGPCVFKQCGRINQRNAQLTIDWFITVLITPTCFGPCLEPSSRSPVVLISYKQLRQSDTFYCVDVPASRCSCCGIQAKHFTTATSLHGRIHTITSIRLSQQFVTHKDN
jgi:hypothetical protein